jgi:hypothetical protein
MVARLVKNGAATPKRLTSAITDMIVEYTVVAR